MTNLLKTTVRIVAAVAVCAALSACGQASTANFPSYGAQSSVSGGFVAPTIMDY